MISLYLKNQGVVKKNNSRSFQKFPGVLATLDIDLKTDVLDKLCLFDAKLFISAP